MNQKSLLFQTVSEQDINRITQRHFSSEVEAYALLKGGLFNTTYLIQLKTTAAKYVLQIGPVRQDLLLPFELHLAEAEQSVCEWMKNAQIPTNRPVASDFSKTIMDRDYMIFEYIESITLSDKAIKKRNKPRLYQQSGAYIREMHQIKGTYYGRVSNAFRNVTFSTWTDYIFSELQEVREACVKHQVFSAEQFEQIQFLFEKGKPYFDRVKTPCLVHADLWAGNIMVCKNQSQIAAVIDTDRCLFGDPDMDLAASWMMNRYFRNGYGRIPEDEGRKIKLLYYQLLCALIDSYVWKVEYCNPLQFHNSCKTIKKLMKKISQKSKIKIRF